MLIRVKYPNGVTEMVRPPLLRHLINSEKISEFRRSDGWVVLGQGSLRSRQHVAYQGEERREAV